LSPPNANSIAFSSTSDVIRKPKIPQSKSTGSLKSLNITIISEEIRANLEKLATYDNAMFEHAVMHLKTTFTPAAQNSKDDKIR